MKKTAAQLEEEYRKAEARAQALREKARKATQAEEAQKKARLLKLVLEWADLNNGIEDIDAVIEMFYRSVEKLKQERQR